ncbi:MAG: DUF1592 domain-containing protein [Archangium sp.]|nr:DUF1592 domain-containing protein [Archangium sp.]
MRRLLLLPLCLTACVGELIGPREERTEPTAPTTPTGPAVTPVTPVAEIADPPMKVGIDHEAIGLRRLTREEYGNTVEDLLGFPNAAAALVEDVPRARFSNNVHGLNVSQSAVVAYSQSADLIAAQAVGTVPLPSGCALASLSDDCFARFLAPFLKRAFRRPATSDELTRFTALWTALRVDFSTHDSLEAVLASVLQSPSFLYRSELNETLNDFEQASRLSYLLWGSMPDDALLAAAEQGQLATPAGRAAQFDRMWTSPRTRVALRHFTEQWLAVNHAAVSRKDARVLAGTSPTLQADLEEEFRLQFEHGLFEDQGSLARFLAGRSTWVNASLATVYGLPSPDAGVTTTTSWVQCAVEHERCDFQGTREVRYGTETDFVTRTLTGGTACDNTVFGDPAPTLLKYCWVATPMSTPGVAGFVETSLVGTERRGVLTSGLVLAAHSKESGFSTPQLGKFLRTNVLCQTIEDPPANVPLVVPSTFRPEWTYRQRFDAYTQSGAECASCHRFINPAGYAYLPFDPIGRFSPNDERGQPFETGGDFPALDSRTVRIGGAAEMSELVANSARATACFTRMTMEFAFGRTLAESDLATLDTLATAQRPGEVTLRGVLRDFVSSAAFATRGPLE